MTYDTTCTCHMCYTSLSLSDKKSKVVDIIQHDILLPTLSICQFVHHPNKIQDQKSFIVADNIMLH